MAFLTCVVTHAQRSKVRGHPASDHCHRHPAVPEGWWGVVGGPLVGCGRQGLLSVKTGRAPPMGQRRRRVRCIHVGGLIRYTSCISNKLWTPGIMMVRNPATFCSFPLVKMQKCQIQILLYCTMQRLPYVIFFVVQVFGEIVPLIQLTKFFTHNISRIITWLITFHCRAIWSGLWETQHYGGGGC